jgi:hypothetical protein
MCIVLWFQDWIRERIRRRHRRRALWPLDVFRFCWNKRHGCVSIDASIEYVQDIFSEQEFEKKLQKLHFDGLIHVRTRHKRVARRA